MNTITRGGRGRKVALTATILAVVGLGLAGCQTGVVDPNPTEQDAPPSAAQVERSAAAAQARYEGLAEHWAERARAADGVQTATVADASQSRYEGLAEYWARRAQQADTSVRVLADRLDTQREAAQVRVLADRVDTQREATQVRVLADRVDTHE
jgi:hypothetical protein